MIKFIENSDAKLKFGSYPILEFCNRLIILVFLIPLFYWSVFLSPASSSLNCQRNVSNYVNCQLQESNLLGFNVTKVNIINLRKANAITSRNGGIVLKANSKSSRNLWLSNIVGFQETYFFPSSNRFALVFYSNLDPRNWFKRFNQANKINQFIRSKLNQEYLSIQQQTNWIGFFAIITLFLDVITIIKNLLNIAIETIYEFDGKNKILIVNLKSILNQNTTREYQFDSINQIRLDENNTRNIINGHIVLQFKPEYDYFIEQFVDMEYGKRNFQILQEFLEQNK